MVYPVTNEAGQIVERYGVVMDVTERKRAEKELQRSLDQLRALAARVQDAREEEGQGWRVKFMMNWARL